MGDFDTSRAGSVKEPRKIPEMERGDRANSVGWGEFGAGGANSCDSLALNSLYINSTSVLTDRIDGNCILVCFPHNYLISLVAAEGDLIYRGFYHCRPDTRDAREKRDGHGMPCPYGKNSKHVARDDGKVKRADLKVGHHEGEEKDGHGPERSGLNMPCPYGKRNSMMRGGFMVRLGMGR